MIQYGIKLGPLEWELTTLPLSHSIIFVKIILVTIIIIITLESVCDHFLMNVVFCICLLAQTTATVASTDISASFMDVIVWELLGMGGAE